MQKLFWIGSPFFQESLTTLGWQVHFFNFEHVATFTWQDLVNMAGFEPHVVVVADKSRPPFVLGIEDFPCLTVFYAVDTHIHSWYPHYAQAFDACLVSLKDHLPLFQHKVLQSQYIRWSPAFAKNTDAPTEHPTPSWDCLFVGTVHAETTPKRQVFLQELQEHLHCLHSTRGNYVQLFPQGRVILNHCEQGDLNFRVFEALGCGACLLTPHIGHGISEIFTHGKELYYYEWDQVHCTANVHDAAQKITHLLKNDSLRHELAEQGLAKVNAAHRALHRAQSLTDFLDGVSQQEKQARIAYRRKNAQTIRERWLKPFLLLLANAVPQEELRRAYLQAARGVYSSAKPKDAL